MIYRVFACLLAILISPAAVCATTALDSESKLDEIVVSGEQPGPALWRVSAGDHVLWILGEIPLLPKDATWRSKQFESLLATAEEVLLDGRIYFKLTTPEQKAAWKKAETLPDGIVLKDVISAELYARLEPVRNEFAKKERLDRMSPFFASSVLANNSLKRLDVKLFGASPAVRKLAQQAKVKVTQVPATPDDVAQYLRAFENGATEPCLEHAVDVLENRGAGVHALANAWAIGDIDTLRKLTPKHSILNGTHAADKCSVALHDSEASANEVVAKHTAKWLAHAQQALSANKSTIAVVPVAELLSPDGYLAELRNKGYEVVEPE